MEHPGVVLSLTKWIVLVDPELSLYIFHVVFDRFRNGPNVVVFSGGIPFAGSATP